MAFDAENFAAFFQDELRKIRSVLPVTPVMISLFMGNL
jgi:hypothetical protein